MLVEEKEKEEHPQETGTHSLKASKGVKMSWKSMFILIFIPVIVIQLFALWELYKNWKNTADCTNLSKNSSNVKRYEYSNYAKLQFDSYLRDFDKTYKHEEYARRIENFLASLKEIDRLNELENNTVFGLTKFSDMSKEEFVNRMLSKPRPIADNPPPCQGITLDCESQTPIQNNKLRINNNYGNKPPRSYDWRSKDVVKPVLNQKRCEGCWAFSIVGVMESMSAIELNDSSTRSIQELLDCSPDNNGCFNGSVTIAMRFICGEKLQFVTAEEYPLTLSIDKNCQLPTTGYSGRMVKAFVHNCQMNEDEMVADVASHGPLIAAVDSSNWQNYIGGVITRACTRGISNHVIQIVGYEGYGGPDENTPIPYYIVRNSFGEDFGDNGYVKIAMKHYDSAGRVIQDVCGIAEQVTAMDVM